MQRPDANVALVHHGASGSAYGNQFTIGYTQSTLTDTDIGVDTANIITVNILGNLVTQNNLTVGSDLNAGGNVEALNFTASDTVSMKRSLISNVETIGTIKTFVVTVQQVSGVNKYFIDGVDRPLPELHQHQTYIFDLSSSTLSGHPFRISETSSGDEYDTGITNSGVYASTQKRTFIVPADAPATLYYYCTYHSGMGATMSISSTAELIVSGRVVASGNVEASAFIGSGLKLTGVAFSTDLVSNVDRIASLETNLTDNSSRIDSIVTDVTDNSSRIGTVITDLSDNSSRIDSIVTDVTDNTSRIATLETDMTDNASRTTVLETDMTDNASRTTVLEIDVTDNASRITTLETDVTDNASRITVLETDMTDNASRTTVLEVDATDNASRITTLETDMTDNASRTTVLEIDVTDNTSRIATLETDMTDNSSRIDSIVTDVTDNSSRIGTVITDLSDNSSRIDSIVTDVTDNSSRIGTVITDLSDNSSRIDSIVTDVTDNSSRIGTVITDLSDNSSRIDSIVTDITDNSSRIGTVITDLSDNSSRIDSIVTDVTDNASRITSIETSTTGDLLVATGTNTLGKLGIGSSGQVLTVASGGSTLEWGESGSTNVFSETVSFSNVTTGLIATGNVYALDVFASPSVSYQQELLDPTPTAGDWFGYSVSISGDGMYAIIGSPYDDTTISNQGATHIFIRSGTSWTRQQKLVAPTPYSSDVFGWSVSMSDNGLYAIVGVPEDSGGVAHVFIRSGTTWTHQQELTQTIGNVGANDKFGWSVSISADGTYALVGAIDTQGAGGWPDRGGVHVFIRSGTSWTAQQKLVSTSSSSSQDFGASVSISNDGVYAVIGSPAETVGSASGAGVSLVFIRSGTSWTEQQELVDPVATADENFGCSVSISSDGTYALIGAEKGVGSGEEYQQGEAHIFIRSGTSWTHQQKINLTGLDLSINKDQFGHSVSISNDGTRALIGANREGSQYYGAGYVFDRSGTSWTLDMKLSDPNQLQTDYLGSSAAISGDGKYFALGAIYDDAGGTSAGAAHIFMKNSPRGLVGTEIDLADNSSRIGTVITDLSDNSSRIDAVVTDMTSNMTRIESLETSTIISNSSSITSGFVKGDIIYASATNTLSNLALSGTAGDVLKVSATGIPEWAAESGGAAGGQWSIDAGTNEIYYNTAFVGIGTSNPSYRLDVHGTANVGALTATSISVDGSSIALESDLADNSSRIGTVITDLSDNSSRIDSIVTDVTDNSSRIGTVITDLSDNSSRIDSIATDVTDNSSRIGTVITDLSDNSSRIDSIATDVTDNSSRIGTVITDLSDNSSRIDSIVTDVTDNSSRIGTVITDLSDNSSRIDSIVTDVASNAGKISFITSTADSTVITSNLDITGNVFIRGDRFVVESETKLINDAVIGIANNNVTSTTDIGLIMQRPESNVAIIHHGASGSAYGNQFTIGYTQSTLTDTDIGVDTANIITVNILGNLVTQNNLTVGSDLNAGGNVEASKFLGDGTFLTGIALNVDLVDNASRITTLESANTVQGGLITAIETDVTDNASRITTIETSTTGDILVATGTNTLGKLGIGSSGQVLKVASGGSTLEWAAESGGGGGSVATDLADNSSRITSIETSTTGDILVATSTNTLGKLGIGSSGQVLKVASGGSTLEWAAESGGGGGSVATDLADNSSRIDSIVINVTDNSSRIGTIVTDLSDNSSRIDSIVTDVTDNSSRIGTIVTDLADNSSRIDSIVTNVTDNSSRIGTIVTDLADNSSRIDSIVTNVTDNSSRVGTVITDLSDNSSRIDSIVTDVTDNSSRIDSIVTNITDNSSRIGTVVTDLADNSSRIDSIVTDVTANAVRVDALYTATQGDLIYATGTDTLGKLNIGGTTGHVLKVSAGGVPEWAAESGGGGGGQWTGTSEIYFEGNVGISNTDPDHDLSIGSNIFIDDDGSNVLVISGNAAMSALTLGEISIVASYGLDDILNTSNTSSNTIQLLNATTGLVTTGNVEVGGELTVSGTARIGGWTTKTWSGNVASSGANTDINIIDMISSGSSGQRGEIVGELTVMVHRGGENQQIPPNRQWVPLAQAAHSANPALQHPTQ